MIVLAFLWERDQKELLQEMVDSIHAVIIKVACIGLSAKHLGLSLSEIQPTMLKLHEKFGVHPCGEGGEFESMVLDCPMFLRRIELVNQEVVDLGDTAYLRLRGRCVDKEMSSWTYVPRLSIDFIEPHDREVVLIENTSNVVTREYTTWDVNTSNVIFCQLLLSNMSDFATINEQYSRLWTDPPARVCLAVPMSEQFRLNTIHLKDSKKLWIQSRSYWAPANIGPYSQAASTSIAFISGQIGLVPHTMELASTIDEEILWSVQSLLRIIQCQKFDDWKGVVIVYMVVDVAEKIRMAYEHLPRLDLVIVQIEGTLPRNANVEWQYIAATAPSMVGLSTKGVINFSTESSGPWTLKVKRILLYSRSVDRIGVVIQS